MARNQHFWVCDKCHDEQFEQPPRGPHICGDCSGDVRRREIAVRLLIAEKSPHYVPDFGTVNSRSEHLYQQSLVDDLAEKLRTGEIATPDELPMPIRLGRPGTASEHVPRTTCVLTISGGSGSVRQGRQGRVLR